MARVDTHAQHRHPDNMLDFSTEPTKARCEIRTPARIGCRGEGIFVEEREVATWTYESADVGREEKL